MGFLVGESANHIAQGGEGGVDVAGFFQRVTVRSGERLSLAAGEVDEVELRLPRYGDRLLHFLCGNGIRQKHFARKVQREDGMGAR